MKHWKTILACLVLVAVVGTCALICAAASEEEGDTIYAEPGETVTVSFEIDQTCGIDGYFEYDNPDLFASVTYSNKSEEMTGELSNDRVYLFKDGEAGKAVIDIELVVSDDAQPGDQCDIILNYKTSDDAGVPSDWAEMSRTVIIAAPEESSESSESSEDSVADDSSEASFDEPTPGDSNSVIFWLAAGLAVLIVAVVLVKSRVKSSD